MDFDYDEMIDFRNSITLEMLQDAEYITAIARGYAIPQTVDAMEIIE